MSRALPRFNFTLPVLQVLKDRQIVHRASPGISAFRAAIDMIKARTNALVLMEGEKMVGIVTERDFLKLPLETGASRATPVTQIMTPAAMIKSAPASYTLERCVSMMRKAKVRHLPVVEKDVVKALISMSDICAQISATMKQRDPLENTTQISDLLDSPDMLTPGTSVSLDLGDSVADAVKLMRETSNGSLLAVGSCKPSDGSGGPNTFGLFTERDYLNKVVPYDDRDPADISLREVARFTSGKSKRTMQAVAAGSTGSNYHSPTVTCVERTTPVADCLQLMLAKNFLYVPVTENKKPIDVISMRDINLFLAPPG